MESVIPVSHKIMSLHWTVDSVYLLPLFSNSLLASLASHGDRAFPEVCHILLPSSLRCSFSSLLGLISDSSTCCLLAGLLCP